MLDPNSGTTAAGAHTVYSNEMDIANPRRLLPSGMAQRVTSYVSDESYTSCWSNGVRRRQLLWSVAVCFENHAMIPNGNVWSELGAPSLSK